MEEKLIIRLSNSLGNQMFMYAAGYAAAKILNKKLYYDHISSYITQKNIPIHMNLYIQIFLIQKTLFVKLSLFQGLFLN